MRLILPKNPIFLSGLVRDITLETLQPDLHTFYYANVAPYRDQPIPETPVNEQLETHLTNFYEHQFDGGMRSLNTPFRFAQLTEAERDYLHSIGVNCFHMVGGLGPVLHTGQIVGTHARILEVQIVGTFLRDLRRELNRNLSLTGSMFQWAEGTKRTVGEHALNHFAQSSVDTLKMRRMLPFGAEVTAGFRDGAKGIWFGSTNCGVQLTWDVHSDTFFVHCRTKTYNLLKNICTFEEIGEGNLRTNHSNGSPIKFNYVVNGEVQCAQI